jgi:hypothetical protein
MKKNLLLLLLFTVIFNCSKAQNMQSEWSYDSIKSYYKNYVSQLNDSSKDGAYVKYLRFESMMDYKFNKNSTISDYVTKIREFNDRINTNLVSNIQSSNTFESNWHNITNEKIEQSASGRFTSIWIDPNPPYNIMAGTPSSGIWRTTNGQINPNWENITGFKLKNCGISQIAVSPINPNIIYASTSFSGSYVSWYGMGLIYSTDGGMSWQEDKNLPPGFLNVTNWQWKTKLPIAFEPGTNTLLVGYENRIWKKNCTPGLESWNQQPVYVFTVPNEQAFMIYNIKFSTSNPNLVVCSANNGSEKEIIYSFSGGANGTWNEFQFNSPSMFDDLNLNYNEFHNSVFIDEDNGNVYLLIGVGNNVNSSPNSLFVKRTYLVRFKKKTNQNIFEQDKIWTASEGYTTYLGATNGMEIIKKSLDSYYLIIGQGAWTVYTASFTEDNSSSFSFTQKSNYFSTDNNKQTHADIRDLKYVNGKIYIATDGGISVSGNLCANVNDWVSLNGTGLTAQEILGFDNSEFQKEFIACAAMDGNSFVRRNVGGIIKQENIPYSFDRYDAAISKVGASANGFISTTSSSGPNTNSDFVIQKITNLDQNTSFIAPIAPNGENIALKQFDFEDRTNNFYVGTTVVYKYDDFFNRPGYSNQAKWTVVSCSNINAPGRNISLYTDGPITAFKSVEHPTLKNTIISVYSIKGAASNGTTPPKLMYVVCNLSNPLAPVYTHNNISPYTIDNITNNENSLYKNWIQEVVIDETNPNRIWVCFGGTSRYINNVSGRIYHTENGSSINPTWTDVSQGLPDLPILSMVYWKGSDDIIFAGTDVGVYIYNKNSIAWEPFRSNFPYITVPELDINYCSGTLRACTSGMGIWETPLPKIDNPVSRTITSNETWNVSMDTYQDVLVKTGATLTIQGTHNSDNTNSVEIRIPKDKKIVVEPGAKLIIDGATLTNHCDLWQGIEVNGQKNAIQDDLNQGRLIVKNGSIIENARKAISTSNGIVKGLAASSTGAIITCENSSFINNLVGVEILSYHRITSKPLDEKVNKSSISKCKFETNSSNLFGTEKPTHIYLWDVNGIKIVGSHFVDYRPITIGSVGIKSIKAGYYVNEYCSGINLPVASAYTCAGVSNIFENLEYGIQSYSQSNPKYSVNISNSKFNNCSRAIYLNGIDNASIFLNNFNVKIGANMPIGIHSEKRYGIYLNLCRSYKVENNNLEGDVDADLTSESFGIIVRNMHGENVSINSNSMNKLSVGVEAIGRNRGQELDKGLQIKCNNFSNSKYDIVVMNDPEMPVANSICGIARNQGYPIPNELNRLAGNLFANTSTYLQNNYENQGALIYYYHHSPSSNPRVLPASYLNNAKIVFINQNTAYSNTISCPSSFTSLLTSAQLRSHVITQEEALEGNQAALTSMIDGGNTNNFLLSLDLSNTSTINTNYFLLMNVAPYLSHEVLLRVAEDGTALSNAMIRNILVACAQSAKDDEIQNLLNNRVSPLPQYMRDQINQGLLILSEMENDQREIGSYVADINHSVNETMWRATQDTLDLSANIFEIFNEVNDYTLKMQLANWIDADGRRSDANALIAEIGNNLQSQEDVQSFDILNAMRDFQNQMVDNNIELNDIDQGNIDYLKGLLDYPDVHVADAIALLKLNNQLNYIEPVLMPQVSANQIVSAAPVKINTTLDPSESSLEVNPNPVTDLLTVKYKVLEKTTILQLVITDINGKELLKQLLKNNIDEIIVNCNQFISGNYILTIKGDGIKSLSQKIIISKK